MPSSSSTALFIEPLDVLILRGNKLFADAGSHGEALMPPVIQFVRDADPAE